MEILLGSWWGAEVEPDGSDMPVCTPAIFNTAWKMFS